MVCKICLRRLIVDGRALGVSLSGVVSLPVLSLFRVNKDVVVVVDNGCLLVVVDVLCT